MSEGVLRGKVAIVTGAGSPIGLGRAMSLALAEAGARVAMLDVNPETLHTTAQEVMAAGGPGSARPMVWDVPTMRAARPPSTAPSPSWAGCTWW